MSRRRPLPRGQIWTGQSSASSAGRSIRLVPPPENRVWWGAGLSQPLSGPLSVFLLTTPKPLKISASRSAAPLTLLATPAADRRPSSEQDGQETQEPGRQADHSAGRSRHDIDGDLHQQSSRTPYTCCPLSWACTPASSTFHALIVPLAKSSSRGWNRPDSAGNVVPSHMS